VVLGYYWQVARLNTKHQQKPTTHKQIVNI
jgi:hypothetical protein